MWLWSYRTVVFATVTFIVTRALTAEATLPVRPEPRYSSQLKLYPSVPDTTRVIANIPSIFRIRMLTAKPVLIACGESPTVY